MTYAAYEVRRKSSLPGQLFLIEYEQISVNFQTFGIISLFYVRVTVLKSFVTALIVSVTGFSVFR